MTVATDARKSTERRWTYRIVGRLLGRSKARPRLEAFQLRTRAGWPRAGGLLVLPTE
jgi:hypothetical protein